MEPEQIMATMANSVATLQAFTARSEQIRSLCQVAQRCLEGGGKLLLCGNGGSACDAAHVSCELVGWFRSKDRPALSAMALGFETPAATAISNDKGYDQVFLRQLQAVGRAGDMLIGISTSGSSRSVVLALEEARRLGLATAALVGETGGPCAEAADLVVSVPSKDTPRIQECHLLALHILSEWLESALT